MRSGMRLRGGWKEEGCDGIGEGIYKVMQGMKEGPEIEKVETSAPICVIYCCNEDRRACNGWAIEWWRFLDSLIRNKAEEDDKF
jgi:hypothetical protein